MKRIVLLFVLAMPFGVLHSQNVNYTVEIVEYLAKNSSCTSDGFGLDEEVTWKCWGMDNGNVSAMVGGTCEGWDNNVPMNFTAFISTVLLNETNTSATTISIQLEAWEDDDISNAVGSANRCSYNGGGGLNGDDCYINNVFAPINFRSAAACQWRLYPLNFGDFGVTIRVKWEYVDFSASSPINGCDTQAQLNAVGNGQWSIVSGTGGSFTDNFDTSAIMNGIAGQTYQVDWSMLPGCITTNIPPINVTVNMNSSPIPSLIATSNLCENGDIIFTASNGINYIWSIGSVGNIIDTTTNGLDTIFNITSSDLPVFVTVTDANGCSATESITPSLISGPPVNLGNDTTICSGTTANIDASIGLYSYSWNSGETSSVITPSSAGQYIVTVTDVLSGCSGFDTINVSLYPTSTLNLGNDIEFCLGDTVILGVQPVFTSYTWSDGSTSQTDTITTFGDVWVTIVDVNTCFLTDTINFSPVYSYYSLYSDTTIFLGNSVTLTAPQGSSYQWNTGDTNQSITVSPIIDSNYVVTILQADGCYDVANVNVLISDLLNFFIPTMFTPNNDDLNDLFLMYGNGIDSDNFSFSIYNRWGEIVFQTNDVDKMLTTGWDGKNNGIDQPIGTYIWTMIGFTIDGSELKFGGKNTGSILLRR